ncbi:forkhead box protein P2-like [Cololabis saira]|uniref:forkhead box protein P2-like n=1 Tax=Cololabis saira TaxID=129043 RepID=UPI002AD2C127|nr:forkhead box protein P2-like [Cololabis saira]
MPESPVSPAAARRAPASSLLSPASDTGGGRGAGRGAPGPGDSSSDIWQSLLHQQVFLAMMAPQQTQQLLSPTQLTALIQKQHVLLLHQQQLKEFYKKQQQLQLLQQQSSKELPADQLLLQQLLQLQQQQQLLRATGPALSSPTLPSGRCPFPVPPSVPAADMLQIWKELTSGTAEDKTPMKESPNSSAQTIPSPRVAGRPSREQRSPSPRRPDCGGKADQAAARVLFAHGVCNWPGCESVCENFTRFIKHISSEHTLDDRSTAQCRVQMQVVQQLELQLRKERKCLQAMMAHLYLPSSEAQPPQSDRAADPWGPQIIGVQLSPGRVSNHMASVRLLDSAQGSPRPVGSPSQSCEEDSPTHAPCTGAVRRRHHPLVFSLSPEGEYELYKNTDIRPPFTYATLIRQAIMEASDMQLTLNEIYNWFTRTFAYFRRNAATWKNAVRHNLSLHKCFVRVENVRGAVWTVDEAEYQRRRSQKITGYDLFQACILKSRKNIDCNHKNICVACLNQHRLYLLLGCMKSMCEDSGVSFFVVART